MGVKVWAEEAQQQLLMPSHRSGAPRSKADRISVVHNTQDFPFPPAPHLPTFAISSLKPESSRQVAWWGTAVSQHELRFAKRREGRADNLAEGGQYSTRVRASPDTMASSTGL